MATTNCGVLADVINTHSYTQGGVKPVTLAIQAAVDSNCNAELGMFIPAAMGLISYSPQPYTHKKTLIFERPYAGGVSLEASDVAVPTRAL
jgi:hypothetical protein